MMGVTCRRSGHAWTWVLLLAATSALPGRAARKDEGDLTVEWPSNNPEIRQLNVMSTIRHRYARTHVTCEVANQVADIKEAVFNYWIPKDASITNFTITCLPTSESTFVSSGGGRGDKKSPSSSKRGKGDRASRPKLYAFGKSSVHFEPPLEPPIVELKASAILKKKDGIEALTRVACSSLQREILYIPRREFRQGLVDDREYIGEVKEKTQAQRQFQPSARLMGHISTPDGLSTSRDAHGFRVTVHVPPNKSVTFQLTYEELLNRRRGTYEHVIMLNPEQVVRDLAVDVNIEEPRELTFLEVPTLRFNASSLSEYQPEVGNMVSISRPTRSSASISFRPSVRQQLLYSPNGIAGRLLIVYDVKRELDFGDIATGKKFFMHYFAPVGIVPYPKSVLFLLDTSGSMQGPKISQTKSAITAILDSLGPADTFNIITFSTWLGFWKQDSMSGVSSATINEAKAFISAITVSGGTNMNDALVRGIDLLKHHQISSGSSAVPVIVLLADGEPTSGITNNDLILENVRIANTVDIRIITLGFGDDIDAEFLQRLALQNRGVYRQIYEDTDSAIQIENTFQEIGTLVLKNVGFYYGDSLIEGTQSHSEVANYWLGSEIVVGGYLKDQTSVLVPEIHCYALKGHMEFNDRIRIRHSQPDAEFVERSWAFLTIRTLLDRAHATSNATLKGVSNTRALALALQYSFVTPLTTMVVKNPGQRNANVGYLHDAPATSRRRGGRGNSRGSTVQSKGVNFVSGARVTPFVDNDPHFVVHVPGVNESICFDISGRPGQVMQLIHDGVTGIVVNGLVVGKVPQDSDQHMRTYFGHIQIMSAANNISANTIAILVNDVRVEWRRAPPRVIEGVEINMKSSREAVFSLAPGLAFTILRHIVNKPNPTKVDFLGFYVEDGSALSTTTHGLIGQFQHQQVKMEGSPSIVKKKKVVKLKFTGPHASRHPVKARMRKRRNMETKRHVPCWHVPHSGEGLIHGLPIDYIVPDLDYKRFCMAEKLRDRTFPMFHFS